MLLPGSKRPPASPSSLPAWLRRVGRLGSRQGDVIHKIILATLQVDQALDQTSSAMTRPQVDEVDSVIIESRNVCSFSSAPGAAPPPRGPTLPVSIQRKSRSGYTNKKKAPGRGRETGSNKKVKFPAALARPQCASWAQILSAHQPNASGAGNITLLSLSLSNEEASGPSPASSFEESWLAAAQVVDASRGSETVSCPMPSFSNGLMLVGCELDRTPTCMYVSLVE